MMNERSIKKVEELLLSLVEEDDEEISETIHDLTHHHLEKAAYLSDAAVPLATIATSTSALTITSVLLLLNEASSEIRYLAGINIIILIITLTLAIVIQILVFRAKFRISRVQYHFTRKHYLERDLTKLTREMERELRSLLHLVRNANRSMKHVEWLYHHLLWRFFYVTLITVCVLTFVMIML